jgi:hypothetical protein
MLFFRIFSFFFLSFGGSDRVVFNLLKTDNLVLGFVIATDEVLNDYGEVERVESLEGTTVDLIRVFQFDLDLLVDTVHRKHHQPSIHDVLKSLIGGADRCFVIFAHYFIS